MVCRRARAVVWVKFGVGSGGILGWVGMSFSLVRWLLENGWEGGKVPGKLGEITWAGNAAAFSVLFVRATGYDEGARMPHK